MLKTFAASALALSLASCIVNSESKTCHASGYVTFDVPELDPVTASGLSFYVERGADRPRETAAVFNHRWARISCVPGDVVTMVER